MTIIRTIMRQLGYAPVADFHSLKVSHDFYKLSFDALRELVEAMHATYKANAKPPSVKSARSKYSFLQQVEVGAAHDYPSLEIRNRRAARYAAEMMEQRFGMKFAVLSKCLKRVS